MTDNDNSKNEKRVGGVIISHGQLANELLSAAVTVVGDIPHITAVSIGWHDDVEMARDQIKRAISTVDTGAGVLLLTDMFGGTPTNIAAMFLSKGEIEIVTGVNLPMVVKLATATASITLEEIAQIVEEQGRSSIYRTGAILEPKKNK
ncbi:MAG TPA: PTS sugar transporter subunit IIA [Pyrinomonadaceae bacterium]|jgi:PTS system mannose-specific IIA component|nr:PTS sugar transporter subunit IIA [Pyrinomonadaceae bacterium]